MLLLFPVGLWWRSTSSSITVATHNMKSSTSEMSKAQRSKSFQREGPNWVLIAGSALISTLSIRLGYKLKQVLDEKEQNSADDALKGLAYFSDYGMSQLN